MILPVKVGLLEGMEIAPVGNDKKKYTLIKSNKDGKMYALHKTHIIKLDDLGVDTLDNEWICVNLSHLQSILKCIEFENGKIVSFDEFDIYKLSESLDDEFTEIAMKIIEMSREDYKIKNGFTYEINCRDIIAQEYEKQEKQK